MKKTILFFALAALSFSMTAQNNVISKHFQNYADQENFTKVHVTGKMFDLISEVEMKDEAGQEIKDFAMSIDDLHVILSEDIPNAKAEFNKSVNKLGNQFEVLMTVEDQEGDATFLIDESNGVVRELVIVAHGSKEFVIVSLTGNIELSKVSDIMKEVSMDQYVHKTSVKDIDQFKVYPNPISSSDKLNLEVPEELLNADLMIYNLQGQLIIDSKVTSTQEKIDISKLSQGQYILKVEQAGFKINRRFSVE